MAFGKARRTTLIVMDRPEIYCDNAIFVRTGVSDISMRGIVASERRAVSRTYIPVEDSFREWEKSSAVVAAYDALEDEFALAAALVAARNKADPTREQVAAATGTTQTVVARLESGRSNPSTRTLERFAKATGTRLGISFEPEKMRPKKGLNRRSDRPAARPASSRR